MARDFNYEGLTETIPVREAHRINVDVLSEYLRATLDGMSGSLEVVQMRAGQSNPTYLLTSGDVEWVLRKKPPGELLPSAHAVEREYRVQKALYAADVPVAQMLHLCEDPEIIGTPKDCEVLSGSEDHPEQYLYIINTDGEIAQLNTMRSESIAGWSKWKT